MSTTKLNTKVVNASVKSPASKASKAPAKQTRLAKPLSDVQFWFVRPSDLEDYRTLVCIRGNSRLDFQLHKAVRYSELLGKTQNIRYFEDTVKGKKRWFICIKPTAEELAQWKTEVIETAEVPMSAEEDAFFADIK